MASTKASQKHSVQRSTSLTIKGATSFTATHSLYSASCQRKILDIKTHLEVPTNKFSPQNNDNVVNKYKTSSIQDEVARAVRLETSHTISRALAARCQRCLALASSHNLHACTRVSCNLKA